LGGSPVNYAVIGNAFADEMPGEIAAFMAGQVSSEQGDHRKSILRNIKEVEDALDQARYRRSEKGKEESVRPEAGEAVRQVDADQDGRSGSSMSRPQDATNRVGSEYLRKARHELERRLRVKKNAKDILPKIVWDDDGTTVQSGRAASYTRASNVVTANGRFDFYLDLLEWSVEEAKSRVASDVDGDTLRRICEDEVRRWFEEALAQAVVVLKPLSHDERWEPRVFDTGLYDEGLTAAVISHRWLILSAVKRNLAGRLGRLKETVA